MKDSTRKWVVLAVLATSAGIIYELPYMRYTFYDPLREGLGLTHEEFGELMSFYGTLALIFYIPGGWVADRVSHKYLLTFSMIGTGAGGLYLSTWPSFTGARVLFAFWGITTIFTFWATLLKATSLLGNKEEQGKLFSLSEGGRGVITSIAALTAAGMIAQLGDTSENFVYVIWMYSGIAILVGVLAFILVPHNKVASDEAVSWNVLKDMLEVAKMPVTWILAVVIFALYTVYTTSSYFTPYMTEVLGVSTAIAAVVATFKNHLVRPISGIVGAMLVDRTKSSIPAMQISAAVLVLLIVATLVTPTAPSFFLLIAVVIALIGLMTFVLRGLYFAPVGEVGTPKRLIGAAMGLISTIAFTSDIFNFKFVGRVLDTNSGIDGYRMVFLYILGLLAVAFIALSFLKRSSSSAQGRNAEPPEATKTATGLDHRSEEAK